MTRDWESTFQTWAKPISETEDEKCGNTERMIRDAIDNHEPLIKMNISIFTQGSYKNNTNVRLDSDVDICIRCDDYFFYQLPDDGSISKENAYIIDANYPYSTFKSEIEAALVKKFGRSMVSRGNKAFDVHASSYRVDADVIACFEHRRYFQTSSNKVDFYSGTEFRPDQGGQVINWPKQHYDSGVQKNHDTGNKYKHATRIIKRLRNEMRDYQISEANHIPGFLIECLVWNVENVFFSSSSYYECIKGIIAYCFNRTINDNDCSNFLEVSQMKWLFHSSQDWNRQQVNAFLNAAWKYLGLD